MLLKVCSLQETAQRLKEAMTEAGVTAAELSERSGVGKSSISQYMNGRNSPSNISASKMARVLKVSPIWLMGFQTPKVDEELEELTKLNVDEQKVLDVYHILTDKQKERLLHYAEFLYKGLL